MVPASMSEKYPFANPFVSINVASGSRVTPNITASANSLPSTNYIDLTLDSDHENGSPVTIDSTGTGSFKLVKSRTVSGFYSDGTSVASFQEPYQDKYHTEKSISQYTNIPQRIHPPPPPPSHISISSNQADTSHNTITNNRTQLPISINIPRNTSVELVPQPMFVRTGIPSHSKQMALPKMGIFEVGTTSTSSSARREGYLRGSAFAGAGAGAGASTSTALSNSVVGTLPTDQSAKLQSLSRHARFALDMLNHITKGNHRMVWAICRLIFEPWREFTDNDRGLSPSTISNDDLEIIYRFFFFNELPKFKSRTFELFGPPEGLININQTESPASGTEGQKPVESKSPSKQSLSGLFGTSPTLPCLPQLDAQDFSVLRSAIVNASQERLAHVLLSLIPSSPSLQHVLLRSLQPEYIPSTKLNMSWYAMPIRPHEKDLSREMEQTAPTNQAPVNRSEENYELADWDNNVPTKPDVSNEEDFNINGFIPIVSPLSLHSSLDDEFNQDLPTDEEPGELPEEMSKDSGIETLSDLGSLPALSPIIPFVTPPLSSSTHLTDRNNNLDKPDDDM